MSPGAACGSGATVATFQYDDAGRQLTDGARRMTYNGLDQLTAVDLPGGAHVDYAYGYDGQRIRVTDKTGAPPEHWMTEDAREFGGDYDQYVRVGDRIVARVHLHYYPDQKAAGVSGASVFVSRVMSGLILVLCALLGLVGARASIRGRRLRPVLASALIASLLMPACAPTLGTQSAEDLWQAVGITYFHTGFAAGPVLLTDEKAAVLDERRSEPFGQPIDSYSDAGGYKNAIDFTLDPTNILNKPTDARTGWSYHGARWMAPTTARWLTPDPPVKAPSGKFMVAPWELNPYQYVNQNPIAYWDPDGRVPLLAPIVVGVFFGLIATEETEGEAPLTNWEILERTTIGATAGITPTKFPRFVAALVGLKAGKDLLSGEYKKAAIEFGFSVLPFAYGPAKAAIGRTIASFMEDRAAAETLEGIDQIADEALSDDVVPPRSSGARWRVGDDVYAPTTKGTEPTWSTVRRRFWQNEAAREGAAERYGAENLERMRRGLAPQRYNPDKGGLESMELSHEPIPAREGGHDFVPRWPQDHAAVDPYRKPGY